LAGFRLLAAVAVSAAMVIAGLMAKELGGGRREQILAAIATGIAPVALAQGAGISIRFLRLFVVRGADVLSAAIAENGGSTLVAGHWRGRWRGHADQVHDGIFATGVFVAVVLTPRTQVLMERLALGGIAVSLVIFSANLVWQSQHHFISLDFLEHIHVRDVSQGRTRGFFVQQLWLCVNPATLPLVFLGLWFYFVREEGGDTARWAGLTW